MLLRSKIVVIVGIIITVSTFTIWMTFFSSQYKNSQNDHSMDAQQYSYLDGHKIETIIRPPEKIPFYLIPMIWIADKRAKKKMLTGRLLAWSPRIGIGSGLLEQLIEDGAAHSLDHRLIKLLRMQVSFIVPSAFAIDINSVNYENFDITVEEIEGLQGLNEIELIDSFSKKEKLALLYARQLSKTPIILNPNLRIEIQQGFEPKEIVGIASLVAKVNYWARLIEALGVQPAGFSDGYSILQTEKYKTIRRHSDINR
jgi:hypothetical protein